MRASRRAPAMYLYSTFGPGYAFSVHLTLTMYMRPYWRCHVRFCIYWTIVYLAPAYYVWGALLSCRFGSVVAFVACFLVARFAFGDWIWIWNRMLLSLTPRRAPRSALCAMSSPTPRCMLTAWIRDSISIW